MVTETVDKFEATIFLGERPIAGRHPKTIGLVVMDKHKCAIHTSILEQYAPSIHLTIVGHYHTPL